MGLNYRAMRFRTMVLLKIPPNTLVNLILKSAEHSEVLTIYTGFPLSNHPSLLQGWYHRVLGNTVENSFWNRFALDNMETDYTALIGSISETFDVLRHESLIDQRKSDITSLITNKLEKPGNILFGTGLSNPKDLTVGVPLDFLIFPLVAVKIKHVCGYGAIFHLIADMHSSINGFTERKLQQVGKFYQRTVEDIVELIGIEKYYVSRATSFDEDILYKNLRDEAIATGCEDLYAAYEAADIEYFRTNRGANLKLSWSLGKNNARKDETYFDKIYRKIFQPSYPSIYLVPGKRLDDNRINATPYTIWESDTELRFIIKKGEDTERKVRNAKCSEKTKEKIENHYLELLRLFESITGYRKLSGYNTWQKLNSLIDSLST